MKEYKSSQKRLVHWFEESRENWKENAKLKQKKLRASEVRIRDLEKSRDYWKQRAKEAEKELKQQQEEVLKEGQKKGSH